MKAIFSAVLFLLFTSFHLVCLAQSLCPPPKGPQEGPQGGGGDAPRGTAPYGPQLPKKQWDIPPVRSSDPNAIEGNMGYKDGRWIAGKDKLQYTVYYENDPKAATAPAQNVYLTIPIHPGIARNTLKLGAFGFGRYTFPPPNSSTYAARLDLRDSLGIYVDVIAGVDVVKNEVFWTFKSIDPLTGQQPIDPMRGFLPVNDTAAAMDTVQGAGEGFASYMFASRAGLITGDTISAKAAIVFDANDVIPTNTWVNTIDAFPPVSSVNGYSASNDTIQLHWSGADDPGGTGVREYDIYVSENGAPFTSYWTQTTDTAGTFIGTIGNQYRFFVLATDTVGNKERLKTAGEITVSLQPPLPFMWVFFQGLQQGNDALLSWATTSERDCRDYYIERSLDSNLFTEVGMEPALNGTTNNYLHLDTGVIHMGVDTLYYRLRLVHLDSSFLYSKTIVVPIDRTSLAVNGPDNAPKPATIKAYPNPFAGSITLEVVNVTAGNRNDRIWLYSLDGKVLYEKVLPANGQTIILLDNLPPLLPGVYLLKASIGGKNYIVKMTRK
jgi:hypothetical protein